MEGRFLLQPEILEEQQLLEILKDRGIELETGTSKPKLLEVFHRLCVPLPQRQYKQSRRGKELLNIREKKEREREKQRLPASSDEQPSSSSSSSSSSLSRPVGLKLSRPDFAKDRIKPPPDVTQSKKIKLTSTITSSGSKKASNGRDDFLDRIIIKNRAAEKKVIRDKGEEKTTNKEAEQKITTKEAEEKTVKKVSSEPTTERIIKLKRPVIEKYEPPKPESVPEETKPKKVRQKISWP